MIYVNVPTPQVLLLAGPLNLIKFYYCGSLKITIHELLLFLRSRHSKLMKLDIVYYPLRVLQASLKYQFLFYSFTFTLFAFIRI
jgi:hypothetical protein